MNNSLGGGIPSRNEIPAGMINERHQYNEQFFFCFNLNLFYERKKNSIFLIEQYKIESKNGFPCRKSLLCKFMLVLLVPLYHNTINKVEL